MRVLAPGIDSRTPGRNAVDSTISPPELSPIASAAFFTRFKKHLNELVAVRQHRRQRRIVFFDEFDVTGDAGLRQPLHVIEHHVDVDRLALDRALVGEHLHAIDQLHNAVGFVAYQPRERAVIVAGRLFQQLRRAADTGERILDFVREHGGERDHRTRRAAMGELAVHLVGDGALLEHHHYVVRPFGERRHMQIDQPITGISRRAEIDFVFVDRRTTRAHLIDKRKQGAAKRNQIVQQIAPQQRHRNLEKSFRRDVGVSHLAVGTYNDDRMRQRVENSVGRRCGQQRFSGSHAVVLTFRRGRGTNDRKTREHD